MNAKRSTLTTERLLENAGWVRSMAASLLADPDHVDDVLQDTWVRALARPPRSTDERGLRSWLATVARNLALERNRTAVRRTLRENAAARNEAISSVASSIERVELHRLIVDAVLALPDAERDVVALRYFDEIPPRQIAERLGQSGTAVRSRLSRAIQHLREKLDREYDGDRRAWAIGLIEIAIGFEAATGTTTGTSVSSLSAGDSRFWLISTSANPIAAVVLLLVLGLSAWFVLPALFDEEPIADDLSTADASAPGSGPVPTDAADIAASSQPSATSRSSGVPSTEPDEAGEDPRATDENRSVRFLATFVDGESSPLSGVEIAVVGHEETAARSDKSGRVELEVPLPLDPPQPFRILDLVVPAPADEVLLVARREGLATILTGQRAQPGDTIDAGIVPMTRAGSVRGHLVDPNGNPVGGARVAVIPPIGQQTEESRAFGYGLAIGTISVETDNRGEYRIDGAAAGFATVIAKAETTWFAYSETIDIEPDRMTDVPEIVLESADADSFVSGRVVRSDGRPAIGTIVRLFDDEQIASPGSRITNERGEFRFLVLPETHYALEAIDARDTSIRVEQFATAGENDLEIRFPEARIAGDASRNGLGIEIRGSLMAEGAPVTGARVAAHRSLPYEWTMLKSYDGFYASIRPTPDGSTTTLDDGTFSIELVRGLEYQLIVDAPGFARTQTAPFDLESVDRHRLELHRGGSLQGRVLLGKEISPDNFKIGASRGDGRVLEAQLSTDGSYRFDNLTPGPWQVLRLPRWDGYRREFNPTDETRIPWDVTIRKGKTVSLDLDHSEEQRTWLAGKFLVNGRPPKGWAVHHGRGTPGRGTPIGGDGHFALEPLEPGPDTISIGPEGLMGTGRSVLVHDSVHIRTGENPWNLDLRAGTVEVRGIEGLSSLQDLMRSFGDRTDRYALWWRGEGDVRFEAIILVQPSDGVWRVENVPAGSIRLLRGTANELYGSNEDVPAIAEFELTAGEVQIIDLDT